MFSWRMSSTFCGGSRSGSRVAVTSRDRERAHATKKAMPTEITIQREVFDYDKSANMQFYASTSWIKVIKSAEELELVKRAQQGDAVRLRRLRLTPLSDVTVLRS